MSKSGVRAPLSAISKAKAYLTKVKNKLVRKNIRKIESNNKAYVSYIRMLVIFSNDLIAAFLLSSVECTYLFIVISVLV